jgi:hypothetical protein
MARQRNAEISNDNHYRLKWLLEAARKFIAKLDERLADAKGEGLAQEELLEAVSRDADMIRRELGKRR